MWRAELEHLGQHDHLGPEVRSLVNIEKAAKAQAEAAKREIVN